MSSNAFAGTVKPNVNHATVSMALNQTIAGWNVFTSNDNEFVLGEIMNMIWPSPFVTTNKLTLQLNTDIFSSATSKTVNGQQIVKYGINPKAQWSDGTPVTADDLIYVFQAQCGGATGGDPYCNASWKDIGGQAYDDAGTAGYNQIQSVKGSKPSKGSCSAGSAANRNHGLCPNGRTVTVTFIKGKSYADWQGLFALLPAHVARVHGWNSLSTTATPQGFSVNPVARVLSAEQYVLKSYDSTGNNVILTRNPDYHGTHPGIANEIAFLNESSDDNGVADLANGSFNVWEPNSLSLAYVQAANADHLAHSVVPGLQFEHFDFNQSNPYLARLLVREAIAHATNRQAIINAVNQAAPGTKALDNHMFMNTQKAVYVANGKSYDTPNFTLAAKQMKSAGFTKSGGFWRPNFGPQKGKPFTLQDYSTTAPLRGQIMQLWQNQMASFGIKIVINAVPAAKLFGNIGPNGLFDVIEFAWVGGVFPSGNQSIYCSYTNKSACGSNWDHYKNPAVDKLLFGGAAQSSYTVEARDYNRADALIWKDMATLPIYQKPVMVAWKGVTGVLNNASSAGATWNAQQWAHT